MEELNYNDIEYLRNFIPFKAFFDDLLPRYDEEFEVIGNMLKQEVSSFYIHLTEDMEELIDFLDGNGFEVERINRSRFSIRYHCITVKPQYPPKTEPEPVWETYTSTSITYTISSPTDEEIEEMRVEAGESSQLDKAIQKLAKEIKELNDRLARELTEKGRAPPKG